MDSDSSRASSASDGASDGFSTDSAPGNAVSGSDVADGRADGTEGADPEAEKLTAEPRAVELAAAIAERDGYLEDLQRVTAEFANFRRQTVKRNQDIVAQAASKLVDSLLPVLDACEAAVSQGVDGIGTLQTQLFGVLENEGLSVIGAVGDTFDPNLHEAVTHEALDDGPDVDAGPFVAAVLRTGYAWKSRVLRPAMVTVKG